MSDTNQSPPCLPPGEPFDPDRGHRCNDPTLTPIEFLQAIMRDGSFSINIRMRAARYLALIEARAYQSAVCIRIPDPVGDEYAALLKRVH
jgi:hypothetical protein